MTTQHIDVDSEEFEDAPKALRDAYKKLQKQLESVAGERDQFKQQVVSAKVGSVLAEQGYKNPRRVERDLLADGIDPLNTEAVNSWLAENGDDYAKGDVAPTTATPVQHEQAQNLQTIQQVADQSTPVGELTPFDRAKAEITPDMDGAAVLEVYRKYGV